MGFTTPCFIRKNTPELRKKLEELGYSHGKPEYYIDDDDNKYDFIMCHNGRFYAIADDITEALNDKLKGIKDEALNYALSEFDKQKHGLEFTVKAWKHFALIFVITTIVLTIRLFIQL